MPQISIDPVENYYRVTASLVGRILLFFAAGWSGIFLGRLSVAVDSFDSLLEPQAIFGGLFGGIGELLILVFWPVATIFSAASFSIWLFFLTLLVIAVTFAVFIYSEEPAPAWWLGLVAYSSFIHVIGDRNKEPVAWLVLIVILAGIGSAFWWALRVWHPELVESAGDLFRGRSNRPGYSQIRKKAPPGAWPEPVEGWDGPPRKGPARPKE